MNIQDILNTVFPLALSPARLANNPPPSVAAVVDALGKAADRAPGAWIDSRVSFYLRNAGCIQEEYVWIDGAREKRAYLTPEGEHLLAYLRAGECPRCDGTGVIETQERHGAFMVPDLLPCPECQSETADAQPPLPF